MQGPVPMARDPKITTKIMSRVRSSGTQPEMMLRRALFSRGLRYRVRNKLFGKPDLVFAGARVAVFVDGDRWHGNGWRVRGFATPEDEFRHANGAWWRDKIASNVRRDQEVNRNLAEQGWLVLRLWESAVRANIDNCCDQIEDAVRRRQKERTAR
jgi:DNA mismatch endonuclease (patch repair protein)